MRSSSPLESRRPAITEGEGYSTDSLTTFGSRARSSIEGLALGDRVILDASRLPVPPPELVADDLAVFFSITDRIQTHSIGTASPH